MSLSEKSIHLAAQLDLDRPEPLAVVAEHLRRRELLGIERAPPLRVVVARRADPCAHGHTIPVRRAHVRMCPVRCDVHGARAHPRTPHCGIANFLAVR